MRRRRASPLLVVGAALLLALAGCAGVPTPLRDATCNGTVDCPVEVSFSSPGAGTAAQLEGELSPDRPSMSYAFESPAAGRLQWSLRGPAVHVTLTMPDGTVLGPGVPAVLPLPLGGRYVFSLASNTMAEGIYGPFRLELRLLPPG